MCRALFEQRASVSFSLNSGSCFQNVAIVCSCPIGEEHIFLPYNDTEEGHFPLLLNVSFLKSSPIHHLLHFLVLFQWILSHTCPSTLILQLPITLSAHLWDVGGNHRVAAQPHSHWFAPRMLLWLLKVADFNKDIVLEVQSSLVLLFNEVQSVICFWAYWKVMASYRDPLFPTLPFCLSLVSFTISLCCCTCPLLIPLVMLHSAYGVASEPNLNTHHTPPSCYTSITWHNYRKYPQTSCRITETARGNQPNN